MKRLLLFAAVLLVSLSALSDTYGPNLMGGAITLRPVALASATGALALPPGSFFQVSGTLSITSITTSAADAGRIVIFQTLSTCHFVAGSNLYLVGAADFDASADDCLILLGDGTSWNELFRSAN